MLRKIFCFALLAAGSVAVVHAQAVPAGFRAGNLEAGGFVGYVRPDYGPNNNMISFGGVVDLNARQWYGLEAETNFVVINGYNSEKEFTFSAGPRIIYARGRYIPYAKFLVGLGHFSFPSGIPSSESGSNFQYTFGGGLDFRATRHITLRAADFEYQMWPGFGNVNDPYRRAGSLTPWVITAGAKYRF